MGRPLPSTRSAAKTELLQFSVSYSRIPGFTVDCDQAMIKYENTFTAVIKLPNLRRAISLTAIQ